MPARALTFLSFWRRKAQRARSACLLMKRLGGLILTNAVAGFRRLVMISFSSRQPRCRDSWGSTMPRKKPPGTSVQYKSVGVKLIAALKLDASDPHNASSSHSRGSWAHSTMDHRGPFSAIANAAQVGPVPMQQAS